jgi:hypothetical protein
MPSRIYSDPNRIAKPQNTTPTPAQEVPVNTPAQEVLVNTPAQEVPVNTPAPAAPVNTPAPAAPVNTPAQEVPVNTPAPAAPVNTPAPATPTQDLAPATSTQEIEVTIENVQNFLRANPEYFNIFVQATLNSQQLFNLLQQSLVQHSNVDDEITPADTNPVLALPDSDITAGKSIDTIVSDTNSLTLDYVGEGSTHNEIALV